MHLNDVLAWIESHPGQPMVRGAKAKPQTKVVKLKDSVKASAGGGAGSPSPGIRVGGTGAFLGGGGAKNLPVPETPEVKSAVQSGNSKAAYNERLRQNQEQYRQQQEGNAQRASEVKAKRDSSKTITSKYVEGGRVVQETTGNYETLKYLKAQQPGSSIVQDANGKYILIRSQGYDYGKTGVIDQFNEQRAKEGGSAFYPTEIRNKDGGIDYFAKLKDVVKISEPTPPVGEESSGGFKGLDKSRPTKFTAIVGEGTVYAEQGTAYDVKLTDSMGLIKSKQEYIKNPSARQYAEAITKGEIPNFFLGQKGGGVKKQESESQTQQGFTSKEILPTIYSNAEGKDIFTITGQSKGSKFEYTIPIKPTEPKVEIQSKQNEIGLIDKIKGGAKEARQVLINMGIDTVTSSLQFGNPQNTKPIKEELKKSRKETQADLLLQPDRWKDINPTSPAFIGSVIALGSTVLIGPKILPLKLSRTAIPIETTAKFGAAGSVQKSETIFTGLKVGYGKYSKYLGGKTIDGKTIIGTPKPESLPLEKIVPPSSRGGFPISEETSGLLTTKPYLTELVSKKIITPEESQYIQNVKRGLELTKGSPDIVLRTDLGKAPVSSLRAGPETNKMLGEQIPAKQKQNKLPPAKGSIIQQYYTKEDYLRRSRDIDFQLQGNKQTQKGESTVKSFETELQKVAEPGRTFKAKDLTLKVTEGKNEAKVMELLTKESAGDQYPYTNPSKVFGMDVPLKSVKPANIKTLTYRFQGLRKGSSSTELTKEGVGPAKGREKDIFDLVGYFSTKADQLGGKKGTELKQIVTNVKAYAKKKDIWTTEGESTTVFESTPKNPRLKYAYSLIKQSNPLLSQSSISHLVSGYPSNNPTKDKNSGYYTNKDFASNSIYSPAYKSPSKTYPSIPIYSSNYKSPSQNYPTSKPTSYPTSKPISRPTSRTNPISKSIYPTSKPTSYPTSKPISRPTSRPFQPSRPISRPTQPAYYIIPPIIPIIPPVKPPIKIPPIPFISKAPKKTKDIYAENVDWKGNAPEFAIVGVYKKYDVIYGTKKISKQLRKERAVNPIKRKYKPRKDMLGFPKGKRKYNF